MIEITNDKANQFYKIALERLKVIWELPEDKFSDVEPKSADELVCYLGCIFGQAQKSYDEYKALANIVAARPEFSPIATQMYQELFAYLAPGDERVDAVMNVVEKVHTVIMGELEAEFGFEINKIFMPLGFTAAMIEACIEEDKARFEAELGAYKTIDTLNQSGLQAMAIISLIENHVNNRVSERMIGVSEYNLTEIPEQSLQMEYNRHILMYRSIKELMRNMPEESNAWGAYFINNDFSVVVSKELDVMTRTLIGITTIIANWKNQLHSYFCQLSPSYAMPTQKRQQLYEILSKYASLISQDYRTYCDENNVGEPLSNLFGTTEIETNTDSESRPKSTIKDYREYFAPVAPKIEYSRMREIAARLAGKERIDNRIIQSQVAYVRPRDIVRLCYFLLHEVSNPDQLANVDFNEPIQWLGHWSSLKYFIFRIYGKPQTLPQNLGMKIVEAFRFQRIRNRNKEVGQISLTTFNNTAHILTKVADEDKNRIDNLLQEYAPDL